jgi:hypothetical protein
MSVTMRSSLNLDVFVHGARVVFFAGIGSKLPSIDWTGGVED